MVRDPPDEDHCATAYRRGIACGRAIAQTNRLNVMCTMKIRIMSAAADDIWSDFVFFCFRFAFRVAPTPGFVFNETPHCHKPPPTPFLGTIVREQRPYYTMCLQKKKKKKRRRESAKIRRR